MKFKICLTAALLFLGTCSAQAAPLWHSVVLDDYSAGIASQKMTDNDGKTLSSDAAGLFAGSSSITGRRDQGLFKSPVATTGNIVTSENTISGGVFTFTDDPNSNSGSNPAGAPSGFVLQTDYLLGMSAADVLTGVDTGDPTQTIAAWYSRFVIDLGTVTEDFDITFTVIGDTVADYATATKTVGSSDSNGEVFFQRTDFYGDLNGAFNDNLNDWTKWAPYVTSFGITASTTVSGGSIQFNEVYATTPEPGSMLAMAGLFGGAGLVGFRRRRSTKKNSKE